MGDVVAGAAGVVFAAVLVGVVPLGGVPIEEVVGAVTLGCAVPLVVAAGGPGGEVARGGGQGGSRELADNWRNWPIAPSRVPAGSPA